MKTPLRILVLLIPAVFTSSALAAASLNFTGSVHATNATGNPWVGPSTMWGTVATGTFTASSQSGFTSLNSANLSLLTFSFGNLNLTSSQSPGAASSGFERYTDTGGALAFEIRYNGILWATGSTVFLRTEVDNNNDYSAIGTGQALITGAGSDSAFFNDIMTHTGNTGLLNFSISAFEAIDNAGNFTSTGSMSAIPEPSTYALWVGAAFLGFAINRRRRRVA